MSAPTSTPIAYGPAKEQLTADELVGRAAGLRDLLRAEAAEGERLGRYTEAVHEAFLDAGFYHLLTPKRFNGYELDVTTFWRVVMELAAGDAGAAWNYALGHSHVLTTAAFWPEEAQVAAFDNPRGYFKAGHSLRPAGTATPVDGGYQVTGRSDYQSGVTYGSHATVYVRIPAVGDEPSRMVNALLPETDYEILENWSGTQLLGMAASGSNSVVFDTFVPAHSVVTDQIAPDPADEQAVPGLKVHGNPQYLATTNTLRTGTLQAIIIGVAIGARDEYERLAHEKKSTYVPFPARTDDSIYQSDFWTILGKTDAATKLLLAVAGEYQARVANYVAGGDRYGLLEDVRLSASAFEAGQLALAAFDTAFSSAGSGEVQLRGKFFEKALRDLATARTHAFSVRAGYSRTFGALYLGGADKLFAS
jgi:3-hydroxy-9,10-secoandrosta-1,3,5(10)-triene-9,17-dione monooxygenase